MRRHGWAFCLGLLLGGSAAAQPPAAGEPTPPAPDLPGIVVAQERGTLPLVKPDSMPPRGDAAAEPGVLSVSDSAGASGTPVVPPAGEVPMPATVSGAAGCATPAGGSVGSKPTFGAIRDWCTFRSQSRQSGHFITPYRPPLYTWFPCERRCGPCGAWAFPGPVPPVAGIISPGPIPASPVDPLAGGAVPGPAPETEVLSGFMKTPDGLNFAPGGAPMACPTTQVHRVSHWRPK
ncbi:MAG TPA: hypothetical protein VKD90_13050 [Gemmataceae bacterium]|nr:hypothetical protein [Gemmataceae bacterium]